MEQQQNNVLSSPGHKEDNFYLLVIFSCLLINITYLFANDIKHLEDFSIGLLLYQGLRLGWGRERIAVTSIPHCDRELFDSHPMSCDF